MNFPTSTHVGRLYVESRHLPATQGGGGDIHDVMATPFGVRLLVGDVMGTGLPANRTGLSVLNAWRDLAYTEPSLAGIAGSWAELVCCGHPPPLLLRDSSAAFIEPYAAPPLGLLDLAEGWCRASMIPVGDGDQLLLYTDGVSEARDTAGQFFPLAQVTADTVGGTGPDRAPLLDVLVARLDEHVGDRACDDILLLLVTMR